MTILSRDDTEHDVEYVLASEALAEIESMRATIKTASGHLSGFLGFHSDNLALPQMRLISDCLSSLQPFV